MVTMVFPKYKDILELQKQELLHSNGMKLAQIAQTDSIETSILVSLADKTAQNSRENADCNCDCHVIPTSKFW